MRRRTFLTLPAGAALMQAQTPPAAPRALLEIRYYHLRNGAQVDKTTTYLQRGFVPAAERAGIRPVGCFSAVIAPDTPFMMTVASYPSMTAYEASRDKLSADQNLQVLTEEYNSVTGLGYMRMESSLLLAFASYPFVTPPPIAENHPPRVFELRTYESPNDRGLARKIKMFGEGEFDIFRRLGMLPVFFGQTVFGTHLPNLTYMLAYDDLAAREKAWAAFSTDPQWLKLRTTGGMTDADMVSNTSNSILKPMPFSPIR